MRSNEIHCQNWKLSFNIHTNNFFLFSVYPAETPEKHDIQPASDNDSEITSSLELSLDETIVDMDQTITSFENDRELFEILNKLGKYRTAQ